MPSYVHLCFERVQVLLSVLTFIWMLCTYIYFTEKNIRVAVFRFFFTHLGVCLCCFLFFSAVVVVMLRNLSQLSSEVKGFGLKVNGTWYYIVSFYISALLSITKGRKKEKRREKKELEHYNMKTNFCFH